MFSGHHRALLDALCNGFGFGISQRTHLHGYLFNSHSFVGPHIWNLSPLPLPLAPWRLQIVVHLRAQATRSLASARLGWLLPLGWGLCRFKQFLC